MTTASELTNDTRHSVWLCPCEPQSQTLRSCIQDLSQVSGTDVFAPHMTVLGDLICDPNQTWGALQATARTGPVEAKVTGVGQTDAYFMALFLDFETPPILESLRAEIARRIGIIPVAFRPHLSLAYGDATDFGRAETARRFAARFADARIVFDRLCLVESASDIPISDWKVTHSITL